MKKETCEIWKSALIGVVALLTLVCWLQFQPLLPDVKPKEKIGHKLLENFVTPSQMTRIEFSRIDSTSGKLCRLVLVKDRETWRLPALFNFPAENAEQVAKIVAPLIQLSILDVVDESVAKVNISKIEQFHRECGLLNPSQIDENFETFSLPLKSPKDVKVTTTSNTFSPNISNGVALHVKIEGENGEILVNLLIGNRLPESSTTRDTRFVRFLNDDVVYTVDFSGDTTQGNGSTEIMEFTDRISFNPIDWVDRDLLRISRWDVLYLIIRDYTFSLVQSTATDSEIQKANVHQGGTAVFKQNSENVLSRVWSLAKFFTYEGSVLSEKVDESPESTNNNVLNAIIDVLSSLKIVDVRRKTDVLVSLFRNGQFGSELVSQSSILGNFGFNFFDYDPLDPDKIAPQLAGEGGTYELVAKNGVHIILVFGKKIDDKRVCLVYALFDSDVLKESVTDDSEVNFLEQDSVKKVELKNKRFSEWFYLVSEVDYQKIRFNLSEITNEQ